MSKSNSSNKKYDAKEAVTIAISAAKLYKTNFAGKRLLFLVTDKHKKVASYEVKFDGSNFQHLTGLKFIDESRTAGDFYNLCINSRLSPEDIKFAEDGSTHQKLSILKDVFSKIDLSAKMIGTYNNSHPLLYTEKLVGGVYWAIGIRDVSTDGNGDYVPDTLLKGDIRENISTQYRIIATYIKAHDKDEYSKRIYLAKKIDYEKLQYPDDWGNLPRITNMDSTVS